MSGKYSAQERSVDLFIKRLKANLWPDSDDDGVNRFQVDSMDMTITNSGGTERLARLQLIPGVAGLQVEKYF
jgi:hypothetical protein